MSELAFSKYQASGNDFLIVEDLDGTVAPLLDQARVAALCDRRRGIGADGLIRVAAGSQAPFAFHLTNADGGPAEISGNGMRCLGASLLRRGLTRETSIEMETAAGMRIVTLEQHDGHVSAATVGMGRPSLARDDVPMTGSGPDPFLRQPFEIADGGRTVMASALSMGNPHLVLFLDEDPASWDVARHGAALENHPLFPERTNVEFARVGPDGSATIDARVWERGVGETLACGTGACAILVAAQESGLSPSRVTVRFPGGPLVVERRDDGEVFLGGPVRHVFDGVIDLERVR